MEGADESANIYSLVPKNLAFGFGADTLLLGHELTDGRVRYPADELQRLAAAAPSRVCSRTFSRGDVIWRCRTCAIGDDNTCVVCQVIVHFSCLRGLRSRARLRAARPLTPGVRAPAPAGVLPEWQSRGPRRVLLHLAGSRRWVLRLWR